MDYGGHRQRSSNVGGNAASLARSAREKRAKAKAGATLTSGLPVESLESARSAARARLARDDETLQTVDEDSVFEEPVENTSAATAVDPRPFTALNVSAAQGTVAHGAKTTSGEVDKDRGHTSAEAADSTADSTAENGHDSAGAADGDAAATTTATTAAAASAVMAADRGRASDRCNVFKRRVSNQKAVLDEAVKESTSYTTYTTEDVDSSEPPPPPCLGQNKKRRVSFSDLQSESDSVELPATTIRSQAEPASDSEWLPTSRRPALRKLGNKQSPHPHTQSMVALPASTDSRHTEEAHDILLSTTASRQGFSGHPLTRSNSAEVRYGPPPKPHIKIPAVTFDQDRRKPAPTLQQQARGTLRRPTGAPVKGGGSTWQVTDFVLQPTTIDFRQVSYSPRNTTFRTKALTALQRCFPCYFSRQRGTSAAPLESYASGVGNELETAGFILKNITFRVNPGSLVAVMGPSGCGKTSLLDVIAKRYEGRVHGSVMFNGQRRTMRDVKERVGYVLQNDSLLPALTVEETLIFMGKLSLPPTITIDEIKRKVTGIIKELGLNHVSQSQVGDGETIRGLSGGERRRVSIGVQLLRAPGIILLDEPTTGLDSFNANQLIQTLTKLSRNQHLVMVTIHQPRSDLFRLFNDVILLNAGELVWAGHKDSMLAHFERIGFPCPKDSNPMQYFVTLCSVSTHTDLDQCVTEERVAALKTGFQDSTFFHDMQEEVGWDHTPLKMLRKRISSKSDAKEEDPFDRPSWSSKLGNLTRRAWTNTVRSRGAVFTRTLQLPLLAIYLLVFFTRLGNDQQSVQNRNGLMLETMVEITMASSVAAVSLCPPLRERYHRERYGGLYGATLFIVSYLLHSIPFSVISSFLWSLIMYFGAGLQLSQPEAFFIYWVAVFLLHLVGESLALLMLGIVSSIPLADSITSFFIMVGIALGGGVYRVSKSVPVWLNVLSFITPFKYSGAIMQVNELRRLNLTCDGSSGMAIENVSRLAIVTPNVSSQLPTFATNTTGDHIAEAAASCLWETGDDYLNDSLAEWQLNLGINFGALLTLMAFYLGLTLIIFECRKKVLH